MHFGQVPSTWGSAVQDSRVHNCEDLTKRGLVFSDNGSYQSSKKPKITQEDPYAEFTIHHHSTWVDGKHISCTTVANDRRVPVCLDPGLFSMPYITVSPCNTIP